jgi:phosphate transport system substrate-binding protein
MVNLAQAWAEQYRKEHPDVSVQVSGGGSGVGIASLIEGVADIANSSRQIKDKERKRAEQNRGAKPVEFIVGQDALALYVHKENPLDAISIEELAEIYGEKGTITKWSQLGVQNKPCDNDEIIRVSRQNNSGTYQYFREAVLGEGREYRLGSIDQSGSKDLVALISKTPCAIGYSGMGYHTDQVKWLKVAKKKGNPAVEPSVASVKDGSYPIARPLFMYTLGEPQGPVKEFLDWVRGEVGQKIVVDLGYVPLDVTPAGSSPKADARGDAAAPREPEPKAPAEKTQ